jgi:hypothetical protein
VWTDSPLPAAPPCIRQRLFLATLGAWHGARPIEFERRTPSANRRDRHRQDASRHRCGQRIPLAGYDAERLEEGDARLFLSSEARNHAIGALVHDMRIYTAVEVLFGMHYAEAVTVDDQRRPVADLTRLSLVEPDPSAHPD